MGTGRNLIVGSFVERGEGVYNLQSDGNYENATVADSAELVLGSLDRHGFERVGWFDLDLGTEPKGFFLL